MDTSAERRWQEALILAEQSHKMFQHSGKDFDEIEQKSTEALRLLSQRSGFSPEIRNTFMMMLSKCPSSTTYPDIHREKGSFKFLGATSTCKRLRSEVAQDSCFLGSCEMSESLRINCVTFHKLFKREGIL